MRSADIKAVDARVRKHWTNKPDVGKDVWNSFHQLIKEGKPASGDCEDEVTTTAQLLVEAGMPLEKLFFMVVDSNGDTKGDHLVGGALSDEEDKLIFGDTLAVGCYNFKLMKHKAIAYFQLSDMEQKPGAPW